MTKGMCALCPFVPSLEQNRIPFPLQESEPVNRREEPSPSLNGRCRAFGLQSLTCEPKMLSCRPIAFLFPRSPRRPCRAEARYGWIVLLHRGRPRMRAGQRQCFKNVTRKKDAWTYEHES